MKLQRVKLVKKLNVFCLNKRKEKITLLQSTDELRNSNLIQ